MKSQNIKKYQQKELNLMCEAHIEENKKIYFFLCRATKAEKIHYINESTLKDKMKPNKTEFPFFLTNNIWENIGK